VHLLLIEQNNKITQIFNLMKIRPIRAEMFHVDRQTLFTKITVAFRNFVKMSVKTTRGVAGHFVLRNVEVSRIYRHSAPEGSKIFVPTHCVPLPFRCPW